MRLKQLLHALQIMGPHIFFNEKCSSTLTLYYRCGLSVVQFKFYVRTYCIESGTCG
jgi:hypothetical protein